MREHDCPWDWMITACAAEAGNLKVLGWARMLHCPCNVHFLLLSATTKTQSLSEGGRASAGELDPADA